MDVKNQKCTESEAGCECALNPSEQLLLCVSCNMSSAKFPLQINSHVIPGYKRGSKLLGCPTANLHIDDNIQQIIKDWNGVYVGWAKVSDQDHQGEGNSDSTLVPTAAAGKASETSLSQNHEQNNISNDSNAEHYNRVFKSVLSIGQNPHFDGTQKTVEPHILHQFPEDFYGKRVKLLVCGFLREQEKYNSLDELIAAIQNDLKVGSELLDTSDLRQFENDSFFNGEMEQQ
mmetsp:Transcript_752/g.2500  ORF Transcript_752/g.2500 Transcript_752/m.2500 type:complete len:231 (+) Transcript_752:1321-2013(+)